MSEPQRDLANRFIPMARSLAKPFRRAFPSNRDELESAALFALVKAARSFDPARKVTFSTYARSRILWSLCDALRRMGPPAWWLARDEVPYVVPLSPIAEEYGRVINSENDPPIGTELEAVEEVESWLRRLPSRHAAVCRHLYIHGRTQREAARLMGCSRSRLSSIHCEAIAMLGRYSGVRARWRAAAAVAS